MQLCHAGEGHHTLVLNVACKSTEKATLYQNDQPTNSLFKLSIQEISENAAAKESLQKKGFTPDSIKKALEELKQDITQKEDALKKQSEKDSDK
jgi:hypothetical protein